MKALLLALLIGVPAITYESVPERCEQAPPAGMVLEPFMSHNEHAVAISHLLLVSDCHLARMRNQNHTLTDNEVHEHQRQFARTEYTIGITKKYYLSQKKESEKHFALAYKYNPSLRERDGLE